MNDNNDFKNSVIHQPQLSKTVNIFLPSATVVVQWLCFHKRLSFCPHGGCASQGGVHGGEEGAHAWQGRSGGVCMVGEMATAADGTHPTGMHSYKYRCVGLK